MTYCIHGTVGPSVCGSCLIDSIQDGRPSAVLYGLIVSVEKEISRLNGQNPITEVSHTAQRLCDIMCHTSSDISRTYGLRLLFFIRGYLPLECFLSILNMLVEQIEMDSDTWTIGFLIALCLAIPYKDAKFDNSTESSAFKLLRGLPQYIKIIGTYLEAGNREMLSEVMILIYVLALRLSTTLLGDHTLIADHDKLINQFHEHLQRCIKLCSDPEVGDNTVIHGMRSILCCQEAIFSIIPLKRSNKRKGGNSGRYSQGKITKINKSDTEPDYKQILAAISVCFSDARLDCIDFIDICYTINNSISHIIYSRLEPSLSEICEGFNMLQQTIQNSNVTTLINLFFLCSMHGDITKATIIRLLAGLVAVHGAQYSGTLFNSTPMSIRDTFLIELNTITKLKLLTSEISKASIIVSGILLSQTNYSAYSMCIEYLNEALTHPLTHGTIDLLSLPVIVSRDDFLSFITKIQSSPDDSRNKIIYNTKSMLIIRHLNCKLKQRRVPSSSALVNTLIKYCSNICLFDAALLESLDEILEEILVLNLERENWYRLYHLLSPLLHVLFDTEMREDDVEDQELKILKTKMLDTLMVLAAKYWMLKDSPSMTVLATAIDNLRVYGRGALNSMDSILLWIILSYLTQNNKQFDIVGTISFILSKLDMLQGEPDNTTMAQRYLAVLIQIFLGQTNEYRAAETGRSLYIQIWRYIYQITGTSQSFSCEEEEFLEHSLQSCNLLVHREENTRQRTQVVCSWFAKKKKLKQQLDPSLTVQLCFLDVAQNYRDVYPIMDIIINRYKPKDYLVPLPELPQIDVKTLCNIVGLSSISPGFSPTFAGLLLCKICCDHLQDAGVIGDCDNGSNSRSKVEPSQTALDTLERLLKRVKSRQAAEILPIILLVSMYLLSINVSNQSKTMIELMQLSAGIKGELTTSVDCEVIWLYSALILLLYIDELQNDTATEMLLLIIKNHTAIRSDEDPISTLLVLQYYLSRPVTIESACEIGVAIGTLSIHMHRWHHAIPEYIVTYFQQIEQVVIQNRAVKAMSNRGFVFFPGETARKFTKQEDKLSWCDITKDSNEVDCLTLSKRLLFLILTKQLHDKLERESMEEPTVLQPA